MAQESWNRDGAEGTDCQPPEAPLLCVNNCGFFGCAATMNMCSKCYREVVLKQGNSSPSRSQVEMASPLLGEKALISALSEKPASITASQTMSEQADLPSLKTNTTELILYSPEVSDACSSSQILPPVEPVLSSLEDSSMEMQHQQLRRQTANKCFACRRRVGLLGFKCRCGDVFCSLHRYSEKHNCSFDYKAAGRDAIAKANPLVKADKIQRI